MGGKPTARSAFRRSLERRSAGSPAGHAVNTSASRAELAPKSVGRLSEQSTGSGQRGGIRRSARPERPQGRTAPGGGAGALGGGQEPRTAPGLGPRPGRACAARSRGPGHTPHPRAHPQTHLEKGVGPAPLSCSSQRSPASVHTSPTYMAAPSPSCPANWPNWWPQ